MATAAVGRAVIESERARWRPSAKTRPRARATLPMARARAAEEYGHPSVAHRVEGYPLEVRVWKRRPANCPSAIYHPSGVWVALRLV